MAVIVAVGVNTDGRREVLDMITGHGEAVHGGDKPGQWIGGIVLTRAE